MFNMNLTSEQLEFRSMLREFVNEKVKIPALNSDRLQSFHKPILNQLLTEISELGLRSLSIPEELGGVGGDLLTSCVVLEEISVGDADLAITIGETSLLAGLFFKKFASDNQKDKYLERFLEDLQFHLCFAGSDTNASDGWYYPEGKNQEMEITLRAETVSNEVVINGSVDFITNGPISDLIIAPVKLDQDYKLFIIEKSNSGIKCGDEISNINPTETIWHHGICSSLEFSDCRISKDDMLNTSDGNIEFFKRKLVQKAAINLGVGRAAFEAAIEYAKIRYQGGSNIIEHQAIGKMIADMAIKIEHARAMLWKTAWAIDNQNTISDFSMNNLPLEIITSSFTAEAMQEVAHLSAECFGAMGVMRDMPLQKYLEDSLIFLNSDTQNLSTKLRIAEAVADLD